MASDDFHDPYENYVDVYVNLHLRVVDITHLEEQRDSTHISASDGAHKSLIGFVVARLKHILGSLSEIARESRLLEPRIILLTSYPNVLELLTNGAGIMDVQKTVSKLQLLER